MLYSNNSETWTYLGMYSWLFSLFVIIDYYAVKRYPQPAYTWDKPRQIVALYIAFSFGLFIFIKDVILK